jgi:intein-encoded DNA endonuclease-like protein
MIAQGASTYLIIFAVRNGPDKDISHDITPMKYCQPKITGTNDRKHISIRPSQIMRLFGTPGYGQV